MTFLSLVTAGLFATALVACGDDTSGGGGTGGGSGGSDDGGGGSGDGGTPTTGGGGAGGEGGTPEGGGGAGEGGAGGGSGDFVFDGSGFGPHAGTILYVRVLDAGGTELDNANDTIAGDGTFSFTFPGIDASGGFVDYYASLDDDPSCGTIGQTDHAWHTPVPADENALSVVHTTDWDQAACDGFPEIN